MRSLVVHMQTTLDNRIAKADGTLWEPFPWGEEMTWINGRFQAAPPAHHVRILARHQSPSRSLLVVPRRTAGPGYTAERLGSEPVDVQRADLLAHGEADVAQPSVRGSNLNVDWEAPVPGGEGHRDDAAPSLIEPV